MHTSHKQTMSFSYGWWFLRPCFLSTESDCSYTGLSKFILAKSFIWI